ncbi:segregation and condensation protein B [Gloeobacter kilaueensis JS1]|uniref:Segregation and condensation protein B n=1 Tax=Gloeobacter kilaueensis (strain ATCC BAA-2537 / CCAP 1431/1 / ULC 316 / JS1) TaxID=1183438 RepID=U5QLS1_GLOK1|nr:segregation and condensation protein B [Gloeobacter kilaueensis JS1]
MLYLKARPLNLEQLSRYAECSKDDCREALLELLDDYARRDSALEIADTAGGYALQLRPPLQDLIQRLVPTDIGIGAQRTLALIALKGPLPQSELVELRGSGAYDQVRDLVQKGFISRQVEGRSYKLRVTEKFYQYFAIEDVQDLVR